MDMDGKDKFEQEKGNEDLMSYHSPNVSSDWQFGGSNLTTNASMGSIATGNPMAICKENLMESASSSSASLMNSFCPAVWDHPVNIQNLGLCDINLQTNTTASNTIGSRKGPFGPSIIDRTLDIGWAPPNSMVKGGMVLPTGPGTLPQSLSQFPADSGFIERAAKFSCFSGGTFGDMMNSFSISESMNPYAKGTVVMQRPQGVLAGNGLTSASGWQTQKNELNMAEASKGVSLSVEHGANEGSPLKNERKSESIVRSDDEAKQRVVGTSGNESDGDEFSGSGGQEEPSMLEGACRETSSKALGLKKRKRGGQQRNELGQIKETSQPPGESSKDNTEIEQKGDHTPTSTTNKPTAKHGKQGSQASDSLKEEYIHVRARRGQATNSHSLAERVILSY